MKHDIKKLITDYLDGLIGKTIIIYGFRHAYGLTWFTNPVGDEDNKITRKILGSEIHFFGDYFGIQLFFNKEQEEPHYITMYLGWDIPTFETID